MVTAPLLSTGIPVDLPRAHARNIVQDTHPIIVTVRTDEQIFVHENPVQLGDLVPMLDKMTQGDTATRIFIRGDRRLIYERITQVMGELHAAGFSHVALVVDQLPNGSLKKEH
jgi:biopolymer transport protein TolR